MEKRPSFREWLSIQIAKRPRVVILLTILLMNICFIFVSAMVISRLAPSSLQYDGFWPSVFYTITMILDAGCISFVVADVGTSGVAAIIACLIIVLVGMITFTGAVIGYVTSFISDFISSANAGAQRLRISGHIVILNWNSRASEIVNDLLYSEHREKLVVLVPDHKEDVEKEIEDRLLDTLDRERKAVRKATAGMNPIAAWNYRRKNLLTKNNVTVIVREGDTFSTKKLNDVAIKQAKAVVILGKDFQSNLCKYELREQQERQGKGNTNTIKTLIQVAELAGSEDSLDHQKIVVEVEDNWTLHLVNRIIAHKENLGKCHIIPVPVNQILGQILSQFSIMPELNSVYSELLSNKGAAFYSERSAAMVEDDAFIRGYLLDHPNSIPLTCMESKMGVEAYYMAGCESDITLRCNETLKGVPVAVNPDFWLEKRNVIILGHNSKSLSLMEAFNSFRSEWNFRDPKLIEANGGSPEILNVAVVDDERSLERLNHYRQFPYVDQSRVVAADVFDRDVICKAINDFVDANTGDTSVLILSDDLVTAEEHDANALTFLIYVQDIIAERKARDPYFDPGSIDVVVEILNPKNSDIVRSYSIDNVVISNRYISKMITQISEKESIYQFYHDILTYDEEEGEFESKELYIKKAHRFFDEIPGPCMASQLIRGIFEATRDHNAHVLLGYVRSNTEMVIFHGDLTRFPVELRADDKLIMFTSH